MDKILKIKDKLLIILILLIALFFRIFNLTTNPPELFSDEITNFISAKKLVTTGSDINEKASIFFYNRVESRSPIYGYMSYLSSLLFGSNTFAIRLPAALLGTLSVFIIYKITLLLTKSKSTSLLATITMAIIPWQIHYSRIGWEASVVLPFLLFSIYLFLKSLKSNSLLTVLLAYLSFGLLLYTHRSGEFISFLFVIGLLIIYRKECLKNQKKYFLGLILFLTLSIPLILFHFKEPLIHDRSIRIFTFSSGLNKTNVQIFVKNYFSHFSPDFLFLNGDNNLRHGNGKTGNLYLCMLPFILIGIISIIKKLKNNENKLLFFWLLIFPLGGSLTNDGVPHSTRTLIGGPIFIILCSIGLSDVANIIMKLPKKLQVIKYLSSFLLLIAVCCELFKFFNVYYIQYPKYSYQWWDYGNREIYEQLKQMKFQKACLDSINYWNEQPLTFYYLGKLDPRIIAGTDNWQCSLENTVLVYSNDKADPENSTLIKSIKNPYGEIIWNIYLKNSAIQF